jgi:lysozyme
MSGKSGILRAFGNAESNDSVNRPRGGSRGLLLRVGLTLALLLILWLVGRNMVHNWTPNRDDYPMQGVAVSAANGPIDWPRLKADGVDFTYISATHGAASRDKNFELNRKGAGDAGIRFGAIHHFDLCRLSGDQAGLFVTTVPRQKSALPPVVALHFSDGCQDRPGREVVLSELNTLLNLVESHSEKSAVLHITKDFDDLYQVSQAVNRTVWMDGNFVPPDYAAKAFVLWTANDMARVDGMDGPVQWLVVRPSQSQPSGGAK